MNENSCLKKGVIFTLLFRIVKLYSSSPLIMTEIAKLTKILRFKGYSMALISKCIKIFLDKYHGQQHHNREDENSRDKKTLTLFLPYLGQTSLKST